MRKRLGQGPENSSIHAMRDGAYRSRPIIPLLDSVPLHLSHVVRLNMDPTNRPVDNLLPPRSACARPVEDRAPLRLLRWSPHPSPPPNGY